jgi:hypothetical protein
MQDLSTKSAEEPLFAATDNRSRGTAGALRSVTLSMMTSLHQTGTQG